MSKYQPLEDFLNAADAVEVAMTFAEIEAVIEAPLPPVARKQRAWWSNNPLNSAITRAWLEAGYKSERVNMAAETLVFRKEVESVNIRLTRRKVRVSVNSTLTRGAAMSAAEAPTRERLFRCSFCAKPQTDVKVLIAGPGVHICNECVALTGKIIADHPEYLRAPPPSIRTPEKFPTPDLLRILKLADGAADAAFESMQDIVGILREREVSWEIIGETLGVSRQAAWKRFA